MPSLEYQLSAPLLVVIEITKRCNLHCAYCYNRLGEHRNFNSPDLDFQTLAELIEDIANNHVFEVNLSGGEPLLHPEIIQVIELLKSKNIGISIVSNGTMVTEEKSRALSDLGIVPNIQISFDSHLASIHEKTRGLFDLAFRGFRLLVDCSNDRDSSPSVGIVINRFNFDTVCETIRFFSQYTSRFHVMNVMGHPELSLNDFQKGRYCQEILPAMHVLSDELGIGISLFDDKYQRLGVRECGVERAHINCLAGYTSLVIGADLSVFPCDISRNVIGQWQHKGDLEKLYAVCQNAWFKQICPWCQKES